MRKKKLWLKQRELIYVYVWRYQNNILRKSSEIHWIVKIIRKLMRKSGDLFVWKHLFHLHSSTRSITEICIKFHIIQVGYAIPLYRIPRSVCLIWTPESHWRIFERLSFYSKQQMLQSCRLETDYGLMNAICSFERIQKKLHCDVIIVISCVLRVFFLLMHLQ